MANESVLALGPTETLRTARALLDRVREAAAHSASVVIDCAELEQADTAGLQVVLALRNALAARGGALRVINVPADLAWRFDYTGLVHTTA
ncbi:MAG: STAS domain-containing protein [Gemmatimonadaceae bacterium]